MATTAGSFPGMVTPQVIGSTYQNMSPEEERRQWELEQERKAKTAASNAAVRAQRNAQQQAARDAAEREKVHAAFNQLYGQNLQNAYHDQMVMSEGVKGTGVPSRGMSLIGPGGAGTPGQSRLSSGNTQPWAEPGSFTPQGGWYKLPEEKLNRALDNMWRMQTDPYMQMAAKLSPTGLTTAGGAIGGSAPSAHAAWEDKYGRGSKKRRSTTKQQEEQPEGIDWWNKQNKGGAILE